MKRSTDPSQTTLISSGFHLRLPKIDLPKFDEDFSRWLSYRDTFTSMVYFNTDIPTVARLQFLLQSIEGESHKIFETVDIEADNYASTWDALLKRYDNKRFLKRQLFRALYDLAPLKRESSKELHDLVDDYQRHVRALSKLDEPVIHWDTPLINLLSYKLDPTTLRAWEEKTSGLENSVVSDLQIRSNQPGQVNVAGFTQVPKKFVKMVSNSSTTERKSYSPSCHFLFQCPAFSKMSVHQRRELVSQKCLCWNCFRTGHQGRNYTFKNDCRSCHQKHHTLLHQNPTARFSSTPVVVSGQSSQEPNPAMSNIDVVPGSANPNCEVSMSVQPYQSIVLLETDRCVASLPRNWPMHSTSAVRRQTLSCLKSSKQIKRKLTATIKSKLPSYSTTLEFLILKRPTVCLPTTPVDTSTWKFPEVALADPKFHVPADIYLVVGGEIYHELHSGSKISLSEVPIQVPGIHKIYHLTTVDRNLELAIQKYWDLEAVKQYSKFTAEENLCEKLFSTTTTRESSGRYIVPLPPTRDPLVTLDKSRSITVRRFLSLERRLERDPATKETYCRFMEDYERLSHMVKLVDPVDEAQPHCYLPHHPVFKESSTTTKIRVVFAASCKTSSGFSVNDLQLVGPVVQEDLQSIHIRFHSHQIAFVADVKKMYRQILLHPPFRRYQLVLWRPHPSQPIATHELQTVTYGFASAPFLATRTLQQIAQDSSEEYPAAASKVQRDGCVDDFLSSSTHVVHRSQ
ncbi:uncharacterized protein LOC134221766 [Armigeres subalbatus]|uniref:uncharacterized protein LOC134221766 n=1 Tax=Armigeres subalbatus TaxID=124917 RepID=UPI002ED46420